VVASNGKVESNPRCMPLDRTHTERVLQAEQRRETQWHGGEGKLIVGQTKHCAVSTLLTKKRAVCSSSTTCSVWMDFTASTGKRGEHPRGMPLSHAWQRFKRSKGVKHKGILEWKHLSKTGTVPNHPLL
jgi:hypothetical protein